MMQLEYSVNFTSYGACKLILNPIRPGGGGGLRGPDDQTHR